MALEKILKNSSGIPTGEYERISGGTLYADTPVGVIQSFGGSAIPTGWLLCDGAEVLKTDYVELYAVIGDAFGTASVNTKFVLPDLREATTKGAGETGKTVGAHVKSGGLAVGEFLDDRVQEHSHTFGSADNQVGLSDYSAYYKGTALSTGTGNKFNTGSNSGRKGATTEVKSVGVNYIIKAKQVALPADLESAVEDAVGEVMGRQLPLVNLGTEYTAELKADISSGKFEKAVVGGYLTINNHVYYLAHPDYWLHTGDTECTTHHMLVIPAEGIGTGKMNSSNITTGGYAGSDIKTGNNSNTALAAARAQIIADFGASNILTHRELFTTAVTDGKASNWAWADSDVDLMNEVMVYGCNAWGSHPGYETGIDKCQLKLFQERPDLITTRSDWRLRGVVSAAAFAAVYTNGAAGLSGASYALGVRPAFAIC